jgi:stage II sporulation protein D
MARRSDRGFDVEADVRSQRYLGVRGESDSAWAAVRATSGQIISYDGQPALAAFHSASGGRTASAKEVWGTSISYLRSVPVANEDDSPDTYWRASVSDEDLGKMLAHLGHDIGAVTSVKVGKRSSSGRVSELRFRGGKGRATVTGREFRQGLGGATIKSTLFELRREAGEVIFVGSGNGHGVGMSQWAAQAMAEEGADYREILGNFYPGTDLVSIGEKRPRFAKLPAVSEPGKPAKIELPARRGSMGEQAR